MKRVRAAARQDRTWHLMFGIFLLALCLPLRAHAGETGSTDEYAGIPITNSVLLDPFDPVPTIQFQHGGEWDGRGDYRRCHEDCRWHGWYCPHDCYDIHRLRPGAVNLGWWRCADDCRHGEWWCDHECDLQGWHCEHDCFVREPCVRDCRAREPAREEGDRCPDVCYGHLVHEYEERLARHDEEARRYDEQSHWYFEHVMEDHRGFFGRLFDFGHHEGPPPIPPGPLGPPPGPPPGPGGYGPPPGPPPGDHAGDHGGYGPPPGSGHGGPGYGPGPGYDGPPPGPGGYGPPPGPPPGSYGSGPPAGAVATTPPPGGAVATTPPSSQAGTPPPGPGPSSFGPPAASTTPAPTPH